MDNLNLKELGYWEWEVVKYNKNDDAITLKHSDLMKRCNKEVKVNGTKVLKERTFLCPHCNNRSIENVRDFIISSLMLKKGDYSFETYLLGGLGLLKIGSLDIYLVDVRVREKNFGSLYSNFVDDLQLVMDLQKSKKFNVKQSILFDTFEDSNEFVLSTIMKNLEEIYNG